MSDDPTPSPATKSHGRLSMRASAVPRDLMAEPRPVKGAWVARILTLLPDAFPGILGQSLSGRAMDLGLWRLETTDLRSFGSGKHRNVDDTHAALQAVASAPDRARWPVIYLSPRGKPFDQAAARRLAACDGVTLLCGRFEGVDQRVLDHHQIEEISLGDFVMTGGEIAAFALIDAAVRLLPGVLGNATSTEEESFSAGLLEHPQFTRPQEWQGQEIPAVLTSGNHGEIAKWRQAEAERVTAERRPDLWAEHLAKRR